VSRLAATEYRGTKVIVYGDESTQTLKIATLRSNRWTLSTIRRGVDVGPISLCTSGVGPKQALHIFYGELQRQDLLHSTNASGKWMHETIDGNAEEVQDYRELERAKTASNVSVSNACAVTSAGVQVFYRDETQGILLGAVKTKNDWVYEIVDGDRKVDGRTTGDVAFSLSATSDKNSVHLIYDSILTVNSSKQATQGEVRIAARKSVYPEDWNYKTLDGPDNGTAIAGFKTAIQIHDGHIIASWLSSHGDAFPNPDKLSVFKINEDQFFRILNPIKFGNPTNPLVLGADRVFFGCQKRICQASINDSLIRLLHGETKFSVDGQMVMISKTSYLVTALNGRVTLLRILR
jgi:hypothetical protein